MDGHTANTSKALGPVGSGDSLCASLATLASVLTSSAVADRSSPFQSAEDSIARATEALAISTATPPRIRR